MDGLVGSVLLVCIVPIGYTFLMLAVGYWAGSRGYTLRSPFARRDEVLDE
jgi:hypothetical protein